MAKIGGFEVKYTHRGSWKASVSKNRQVFAEVPVALNTDYKPPILGVWFSNPSEASERLDVGEPFPVALARRDQNGTASSDNIYRLFEVTPVEPGYENRLVLCRVERNWLPEERSHAARP